MFEAGRAQGLENAFTRQNVTLQDRDPGLERLLPERLHWIDQVVKDAYDHQGASNTQQCPRSDALGEVIH